MGAARNVHPKIERLLWGIAAGRCEFRGCNKVLYRHEITGDRENYAEKAHIHAVNPGGARFCPESADFLNSEKNLMLVCPQCHIAIDRNEEKYTSEILYEMKREHEERILKLTSIGAEFHSHMVYYTAKTAGTDISVNDGDAKSALASFGRYPSDDLPIILGQKGSFVEDHEKDFFTNEKENLRRAIRKKILDVVTEGESIALFSLAPQPLLIYLGRLLNDKYNVAVFQCHRREKDKWRWDDSYTQVPFQLILPEDSSNAPNVALVFALSSAISNDRIHSALGAGVSIYTVTIDSPNREFVNNPNVMDNFVQKSREAMEAIKQRHGKNKEINVFPVMPASLAVRFGMDYMLKTDNRLEIYDEQPQNAFTYALTIGGAYD